MQSKPKQAYRIGDVVELETPWMEHGLEGNEQEHYWVLTILEIFRSEQVIHTHQLHLSPDPGSSLWDRPPGQGFHRWPC